MARRVSAGAERGGKVASERTNGVKELDELQTLRAVFENLADGLVVADAQGRFIYFNREAERILGTGARDVSPAKWSTVYGCYLPDRVTLFPPERLPLTRALQGEEALNELIFIRNPEQTVGLWVNVSGRSLRDAHRTIRGGVVVLRDVTERQNALQEITIETLRTIGGGTPLSEPLPGMECTGCLERFTRFRECYDRIYRAVEQTADTVVITDRQGLIEYVNPAFEKTTGYSREEALGHTPRILKSGYHDRKFYMQLWKGLLAGTPFLGTIVNRKKSGKEYWAEQTITPVRDDGGQITHFVSVLKDVTELRNMQKQEFFLDLAREVQKRFYKQHASVPGFDIAAAAFPAHQTGGDYFDFLAQSDGRLDMVIGDVSGHGFGAALVMAETRAYLRAYSGLQSEIGTLLNRVNHVLARDLEGRHSVTLVLARLDPRKRTLEYVNAGHVSCYLLKPSGEVGHVLNSTGRPLGMFPDLDYSSSTVIPLEHGDTIVLLTDGVTEASRADEVEFGTERALEYLRAHLEEPAAELVQGLHDAARAFSGDGPQQDDIASVVCKVGAAGDLPAPQL
jgi:PAS domain S-box-containing protein